MVNGCSLPACMGGAKVAPADARQSQSDVPLQSPADAARCGMKVYVTRDNAEITGMVVGLAAVLAAVLAYYLAGATLVVGASVFGVGLALFIAGLISRCVKAAPVVEVAAASTEAKASTVPASAQPPAPPAPAQPLAPPAGPVPPPPANP